LSHQLTGRNPEQCRQELETFLGLHGADTDRIFPVWMEPVDPEEVQPAARPLAAAIDARLKYEFCYRDEERRIQTRWFPDIEPTDREYGRMQQRMAREMAALLRGLVGDERPSGTTAGQKQAPLIAGDHLIMINGGDADADQVLQVAERLWADHQVGSVVPLVAQKDKSDLKPSEITKDLRDNLGLCTAVLMLYCTGPRTQVHQQLKEYQRHTAKLPKGTRPPRLALCHCTSRPLTFRPPGMQVFPVDADCAEGCLRAFVAELAG